MSGVNYEETIMGRQLFKQGDVIRHFKRDYLPEEEKKTNKYLYEVIGIGQHTEQAEMFLVYKALYHPFSIYCRPLTMALSLVDKEKYSSAKQTYRLEIYNSEED